MNELKRNDMAVADWWQTSLGQHVSACEQDIINQITPYFFGATQCQLGGLNNVLPPSNHAMSQLFVAPDGDICATAETLPFKRYSIDNLLLMHVLEFSSDPHQVLREVERVLAADGTLILCSFNPFSLWGLRRLFSWQDAMPWRGRYYSQTRIRDWLALLNFEVLQSQHVLFRPPFKQETWRQRTQFLERWGQRLWPCFGGLSVMVATKRTIPLNPVRQRWTNQRLFPASGLMNKLITRENKNGRS